MLFTLLLFGIGGCIFYFFGGMALIIYLLVAYVAIQLNTKTNATTYEILLAVGLILSAFSYLQHYTDNCNTTLNNAITDTIASQGRYWQPKENGEKYLEVRFTLHTEFPDVFYPVLPTRKATERTVFRVLDQHYSVPYKNQNPHSDPAQNMRYDIYLFDHAVGIVSENTPPDKRKPYDALGQRFDYNAYRIMIERERNH